MIANASAALPPFEQPTPGDMTVAARIVDSHPVVSAYASCEWGELDENGQIWVAAIVREAMRVAAPIAALESDATLVGRALLSRVARWDADTSELCFGGLRYAGVRIGSSGMLILYPHVRERLTAAIAAAGAA